MKALHFLLSLYNFCYFEKVLRYVEDTKRIFVPGNLRFHLSVWRRDFDGPHSEKTSNINLNESLIHFLGNFTL